MEKKRKKDQNIFVQYNRGKRTRLDVYDFRGWYENAYFSEGGSPDTGFAINYFGIRPVGGVSYTRFLRIFDFWRTTRIVVPTYYYLFTFS